MIVKYFMENKEINTFEFAPLGDNNPVSVANYFISLNKSSKAFKMSPDLINKLVYLADIQSVAHNGKHIVNSCFFCLSQMAFNVHLYSSTKNLYTPIKKPIKDKCVNELSHFDKSFLDAIWNLYSRYDNLDFAYGNDSPFMVAVKNNLSRVPKSAIVKHYPNGQ